MLLADGQSIDSALSLCYWGIRPRSYHFPRFCSSVLLEESHGSFPPSTGRASGEALEDQPITESLQQEPEMFDELVSFILWQGSILNLRLLRLLISLF
jgi:hypothetical protein